MFDLDKDTEIVAAGKTWKISRLTAGISDDFGEWAREKIGDPFADLERFIDHLPPEEIAKQLREASEIKKQLANFHILSPLGKELTQTMAGAQKLVHLRLLAKHDDATPDDAQAVILAAGKIAQAAKDKADKAKADKEQGEPDPNPQAPAA